MHKDFYVLVAQIIPVLLIGATLQSSLYTEQTGKATSLTALRRHQATMRHGFLLIFSFLLTLCLGEAVALSNIYRGVELHYSLPSVLIAIGSGVMYVFADYWLKVLQHPRREIILLDVSHWIQPTALFTIIVMLLFGQGK